MINEIEKTFFNPGEIVRVKHKQLNPPAMYVVEKVTRSFKHNDEVVTNSFIGIRCRWFNKNGDLCEGIFSTKDLEKV